MTARLDVTEARLATLKQAIDGTLPLMLDRDQAELTNHGWIHLTTPAPAEDATEEPKPGWAPTAYGRAVAAVWILDTHHELLAYTGPEDGPRFVGDAVPVGPDVWQVYVRPEVYGTARDRDEARAVLWHMAAQALAAEEASRG